MTLGVVVSRVVLLGALLGVTVPVASAAAQGTALVETGPPGGRRIPGPQPINPVLLGLEAPEHDSVVAPDSLPCPDCHPPKNFWMGMGGVLIAQTVPFLVSNYVTKETWAKVSPQTWANNFNYPWQWDDNDFQNNQFAHPYQGNLYYNSGRTNGYDFWASSAWTLGGSLTWEYFFEAWAPAPNDVVNTTIGGIVLGESLYRISLLVLDNEATGKERVWREIGAAMLNPVGGLNRLLRGETHKVTANPTNWHPSAILGVLDFGYRRTAQSIGTGVIEPGSNQWNLSFLLSYGDPVKDLARKPFSYFAIRADLAGPGNTGVINQVSARGSLAAWPLGGKGRHQLALSLEYDYFNNPAFEYSGQSAQIGVVSNIGKPGQTWWGQTQVLFNGVLLGAVQSDYYYSVEGRDYDYGPGVGGILAGRILYKNKLQGNVGYTGLWIRTIEGTKSAHYQDALLLEARYWASRKIGVGLSYIGYTRHSDYADQPNVAESARFLRFFITKAIPGLPLP